MTAANPAISAETVAAIDQLLAQRLGQLAPQPGAALAGFTAPAPVMQPAPALFPAGQMLQPAPLGPSALLVRIAIPVPSGELGGYLLFPLPPQAANPQGLQALAAMIAQAWPVQTYQPRNQWGGGSGGGGGGGWNGGGNGGGGYRGGGRRW